MLAGWGAARRAVLIGLREITLLREADGADLTADLTVRSSLLDLPGCWRRDGAYPAIIQPHHNLPTEYPLEACHVPVSTKYEGLVYPIVRPCLTCFAQSFDAHGNIVYRQLIPWPSALPSAPPTPHVRVRPTSGLGASTPTSLSF
jgi:hypothetical protein